MPASPDLASQTAALLKKLRTAGPSKKPDEDEEAEPFVKAKQPIQVIGSN
jgi:hypothetical protein